MDPETAWQPRDACPYCASGTLHLRRAVFAHRFGGQFVTVPNFPAWVCDICGAREYDAIALEQLEIVLGPEADMRRSRRAAARRAAGLAPALPRSSGRSRPA